MRCSICIATFNHSRLLAHTLDSILSQQPGFSYEVIVVDDGSTTSDTRLVCSERPIVRYVRIDREPVYRNPSAARNVAYRMARGKIIIAQSDDVMHAGPSVIGGLAAELVPGEFVIATVINVDHCCRPYRDPVGRGYGDRLKIYTSPDVRRPLFFLGALYREDLYRAGGCDEEFVDPSGEDRWFALCLTQGLRLRPRYSRGSVGYHQHHAHTQDYRGIARAQALLKFKIGEAQRGSISWTASGGPWVLPLAAVTAPTVREYQAGLPGTPS